MSAFDGKVKNEKYVHCRQCEWPMLGLRPMLKDAEKELRQKGWVKGMGLWFCGPNCRKIFKTRRPLND